MANYTIDTDKICRFCLCRGDLVSFSEATSSALTFEDVLYCTGIKLPKDEGFIICKDCCILMNNTANFRRTCLRNNTIYKRLKGNGNSSAKLNATTARVTGERTGRGAEVAQSLDLTASENGTSDTNVQCRDVSECDDGSSNTSKHDKLKSKTGNEESLKCSPKNSERKQTTVAESSKTSTHWSKRRRLLSDGTDSDDSITSLYGEWMDKIARKSIPDDMLYTGGLSHNIDELCPYCGKILKRLASHINRRHRQEKNLVCPHCPKKFSEKFHLKHHINTWHDRKIIKTCPICGKGFVNRGSYDYHWINSHVKNDVYECETCHRKFKSWDGYKKHLKEHSLSVLKCKDCGKLFSNVVTLETHERRYHRT